jgi:hypothetical protein
MLTVGSISKFLMMSEVDWQNFKDAVDQSAFHVSWVASGH